MTWVASLCYGSIGAAALLGIAIPPILAAVGVSCFIHYVVFSAACRGLHLIIHPDIDQQSERR